MKIAFCIILCMGLGFLSGYSTFGSIEDWYVTLNKPSFNPPNWIFGPAWTVLYILMGIAVGLIWNRGLDSPGVKKALVLFVIQFVFNLIWTPIFFGMHQVGIALAVIATLWILILITLIHFLKIRKVCGYLLVPYLAWVTFATALNFAILRLN